MTSDPTTRSRRRWLPATRHRATRHPMPPPYLQSPPPLRQNRLRLRTPLAEELQKGSRDCWPSGGLSSKRNQEKRTYSRRLGPSHRRLIWKMKSSRLYSGNEQERPEVPGSQSCLCPNPLLLRDQDGSSVDKLVPWACVRRLFAPNRHRSALLRHSSVVQQKHGIGCEGPGNLK